MGKVRLEGLEGFELEIAKSLAEGAGGQSSRTGAWIRAYLSEVKESYTGELYRGYSRFCQESGLHCPARASFARYIFELYKNELIVPVPAKKVSQSGFPRSYFVVNPSKLRSELWANPFRLAKPKKSSKV